MELFVFNSITVTRDNDQHEPCAIIALEIGDYGVQESDDLDSVNLMVDPIEALQIIRGLIAAFGITNDQLSGIANDPQQKDRYEF